VLSAVSTIVVLAAACSSNAVHMAAPTATSAPAAHVTLSVRDITPKFMAFYAAAHSDTVAEGQRWALWQRLYGFAAVPPGAAGDSMARRLVDSAWRRYPGVLEQIGADPPAIAREARSLLDTLAALLRVDRDVHVELLIYVGGLEPNAFTVMTDSVPTVAIPVERPAEERTMLMTHELTHALNLPLAHLSGGWERSTAQTIMTEGLAMRATQCVHPGRGDEAYIEHRAGWLAESEGRQRAILSGILPFLTRSDDETVARFTFGRGTTGLDREAYYAGWLVVGHLLTHRASFASLARVRADSMPALVERTISALLALPGTAGSRPRTVPECWKRRP
jgi:hypothetical protein